MRRIGLTSVRSLKSAIVFMDIFWLTFKFDSLMFEPPGMLDPTRV